DMERVHQPVRASGSPDKTPLSSLEDMERQHILRVLQEHAGNKSKAARALGIERKTLYQKARRLGVDLMVCRLHQRKHSGSAMKFFFNSAQAKPTTWGRWIRLNAVLL